MFGLNLFHNPISSIALSLWLNSDTTNCDINYNYAIFHLNFKITLQEILNDMLVLPVLFYVL